jgi:hypothetical protein
MPSSRFLISSQTLASAAASVTFSSIPATYTDLVLRFSARTDFAATEDIGLISFNSAGINISATYLYSTYSGGTVASGRDSAATTAGFGYVNAATSTSNTFASGEFYIPNYANTSLTKPFSNVAMQENNTSAAYGWAQASFANSTTAISSLVISKLFGSNFVSGSSFYLYGIKNS